MYQEPIEKEVLLVRHSESVGNAVGVYAAADDRLTTTGLCQARALATRIGRLPQLDVIIVNKSTRATETAELLSVLNGIRIEESTLFLARRRPSVVQGRAHDDPMALRVMSEIFQGYLVSGYRHSDEENLDDLRLRAKAALDFLARHPAKNICVITHGSFLWVLFCAVFAGIGFSGRALQKAISALAPDNAGLTRLIYVTSFNFVSGENHSRWRIKSWSDLGHLDSLS